MIVVVVVVVVVAVVAVAVVVVWYMISLFLVNSSTFAQFNSVNWNFVPYSGSVSLLSYKPQPAVHLATNSINL